MHRRWRNKHCKPICCPFNYRGAVITNKSNLLSVSLLTKTVFSLDPDTTRHNISSRLRGRSCRGASCIRPNNRKFCLIAAIMSQPLVSEDKMNASSHEDNNDSSSQARSRLEIARRTDEQIRELETSTNADNEAGETTAKGLSESLPCMEVSKVTEEEEEERGGSEYVQTANSAATSPSLRLVLFSHSDLYSGSGPLETESHIVGPIPFPKPFQTAKTRAELQPTRGKKHHGRHKRK